MSDNYLHGVQYSSSTAPGHSIHLDVVRWHWQQDLGINYVRLQWVDFTNHIRYRIMPISYFLKVLNSPRSNISITKAVFGLVFTALADGFRFVIVAPKTNKIET
jgi:hypothetical protein